MITLLLICQSYLNRTKTLRFINFRKIYIKKKQNILQNEESYPYFFNRNKNYITKYIYYFLLIII